METLEQQLLLAVEAGFLRTLDISFAKQLHRLIERPMDDSFLAICLLSYHTGQGHVCLDLQSVERVFDGLLKSSGFVIPVIDDWIASLCDSGLVAAPGGYAPIILDASQLYLARYWYYETAVAKALTGTASKINDNLVTARLDKNLHRLFPFNSNETDWQKMAAAVASLKSFSVISGGPGTGKTHTVTSIMALQILMSENKDLKIALCAPTGKAAARLTESIRKAKHNIDTKASVCQQIPEDATTIHRLIGIRPGQATPVYHLDHKLALDVLIVDEASMVDLPLMAKLLAALPETAKLILLGDKDQLASVEAGSVFADICGQNAGLCYTGAMQKQLQQLMQHNIDVEQTEATFSDSVVLLQKSYRFAGDKGIGKLAWAINTGDKQAALKYLNQGHEDINLSQVSADNRHALLREMALENYSPCLTAASVNEALQYFGDFRILSAVHAGATGVNTLNEGIEKIFRSVNLIPTDAKEYQGRPVMITRNDYVHGLFNGDIGIFWPDSESGNRLKVWFQLADGSLKKIIPGHLPDHETAWAMTVHKSQGSEFSEVLMLLPEKEMSVVTRELLYTGITRAKKKVTIWSDKAVFLEAIDNKTERNSGLSQRLYQMPD